MLHGRRFDLALAALLTLTTQLELALVEVEGSRAMQHLAFAVMTGALALRRSQPVVAMALIGVGMSAQTILAGVAPVIGGLIAAIVGTYSVAAYARGRGLVVGAACIFFGVVASGLADERSRSAADFAGNLLIFGVLFALGLVLSRRRAQTGELTRDLEAEKARAERVLAEERARIARELHDVIAHHVSVMTLQAGGARQVLGRDPERAREPLETVEAHGRRAMEEMRRLLGILRDGGNGAGGGERAQASLVAIHDLAAGAGIDVDVRLHGEATTLPAGVDLAAYRIVQEALTNAAKHSTGGRATVDIRYGPTAVELEVVSSGIRAGERGGGGHGLVGMRERAALYGGQVQAGADGDAFRVTARLPVEPL